MQISEYVDERDNRIVWEGEPFPTSSVTFAGRNNTLRINPQARIGSLTVQFDCNNGKVDIGSSSGVPAFSASIRVGQDSTVVIGNNVSTTATVGISATEGTTVRLGDDCMIAIGVQIRADDGHPIFDVRSGKRVNVSKDILIGEHVWLGYGSAVLGGSCIGSGSVVGLGAVITRDVPNNAVAVGNPARVVRKNIAWERPHLSLVKPYYKPDSSTIKKSLWWSPTAVGPGRSDDVQKRLRDLEVAVRSLQNLWPVRTWARFARWRHDRISTNGQRG